MPNWQAVSKKNHAAAGWTPPKDYRQAKSFSAVPALATEVSHLMPFYTLAFLKNQAGQFQLFALLGLKEGHNAYLTQDNRWTVQYVPAALRSYPFALVKSTVDKTVLAVDEDSDCFHVQAQANDHALLTDEGTTDDSLKDLLSFMQQRDKQQQQTDQAVQTLAEHGLLTEWHVPVTTDDGETQHTLLNGMYSVDEPALQNLAGDDLETLTRSGAMGIAYAQLFSRVRLKNLVKRQQLQDQHNQASQVDSIDLDKLFGEGHDKDLFSF